MTKLPTDLPSAVPTTSPLSKEQLRWVCDPSQLGFALTTDLPDLCEVLGQDRAVDALTFGLDIQADGYNVFVLGPPGIGKRTMVRRSLEEKAGSGPTPDDWCYLNNFQDFRRPHAISLPAGRGNKLRSDVKSLINDLSTSIPAALQSEEHRNRIQGVVHKSLERQEEALQQLAQRASADQIQLIRTPNGFMLSPMKDGEVISLDAFKNLSEEARKQVEQRMMTHQQDLGRLLESFPQWHKQMADEIRELNREVTRLAIGHLLTQIKDRYTDLPRLLQYFDEIDRDILERVEGFQIPDEASLRTVSAELAASLEDYEINLLVENSETRGAPVIFEDHPSYQNLIGRIEHESEMGALTTDYALIKAGALHRANGGYLVLDARSLLQQPFAWDALERTLRSGSIKIESLAESLSLLSTVSLEPEPIPVKVKVVIVGERWLFYLLYALEPAFAELFKVAADFDEDVERTPENCHRFACFLGGLAKREATRPLNPSGVARLMEHAARFAEDARRLSLHARTLVDLLREADYWAAKAGLAAIGGSEVGQAIEMQIRRSDRVREQVQEEIRRGTLMIETAGARVGQVNGLSVIDLGNFRFGQPARISATVRLGKGEIIDIEREVELGGSIHSKGVLILTAFLGAHFALEKPLSLTASLAFEQSYAKVEGDSASLAELCALLSAIGQVPVKQGLAVTGSINQFGQVQPIGGVNEKIEGFFDICRQRPTDGPHGVIIPATNVRHLMLRDDVVAASEGGSFQVYAVSTVGEAIEILSGLPAGERDGNGQFSAGSFFGRVEARLRQLAELRGQFGIEGTHAGKAG